MQTPYPVSYREHCGRRKWNGAWTKLESDAVLSHTSFVSQGCWNICAMASLLYGAFWNREDSMTLSPKVTCFQKLLLWSAQRWAFLDVKPLLKMTPSGCHWCRKCFCFFFLSFFFYSSVQKAWGWSPNSSLIRDPALWDSEMLVFMPSEPFVNSSDAELKCSEQIHVCAVPSGAVDYRALWTKAVQLRIRQVAEHAHPEHGSLLKASWYLVQCLIGAL